MQKPGWMAGFLDIVASSTHVKTGCYMDTTSVLVNFLLTVFGGLFVAWLFAPTDATGRALRRLRIMGSYLYRTLALFGAVAMLVSSAYEFYKFAYSSAPITRLEVVGLFFYMLNFFVYLVATTAIVAIWSRGTPQTANESP
jgi:hypothetical protein